MISTLENGAWLINGAELIEDSGNAAEAVAAKTGKTADKATAIHQAIWSSLRSSSTS